MVDNLGDQVLFVGDSSSMSSSPSSFNGCKANCVYFTDDYKKGFIGGASTLYDILIGVALYLIATTIF
ncbi:hypothetical protein CFP56_027890 [Quercus suber]|uniref:KIB1-4 beta-propeller domain-containing protein n=1 Tax=Quercus suber TaxID=58331 RepID=A0AAW0JX87_QUESU